MRLHFNIESKFWISMSKVWDTACMSLLWLLSSLPIVTIGASTAAFYHFTFQQISDREGPVWASYWRYFKLHFKKATVIWLIHLAGLLLFALDFWAVRTVFFDAGHPMPGAIFLGVLQCLFLLFLGCTLYIYPVLVQSDLPLKELIRTSLFLAVGKLPTTLGLIVLLVLAFFASWCFSLLFYFFVGVYIFISAYLIRRILAKLPALSQK